MATLVFSAVGTLIGGPVGGAIGAFIGQQVDSAIIGGPNVQGPRLNDLSVSTSSYGAAIPRHYGQMRVAGSIIWATDLVEHSQTQGGSKGSTSVTSYSYTTSFAVALSSRPLQGVGRIWADGALLRGAAGDLKTGGVMRFYPGDYSQTPDPAIAANEGPACPAFRGLSYVVFEDLDLTNYGNRIPALTFEVFADTGTLSMAQLFAGELDGVSANVPLTGITGFSCDSNFKDTLAKFQPVFPMSCNANGDSITISPKSLQPAPIALSDPATSESKGAFGGQSGFSRKRAPLPQDPPRVLRYYDINLDYQPGSQRALGQPIVGKPKTIQLPASLSAENAFLLISQTTNNANWARDTIAWRSIELDPTVVPGTTVTIAGQPGLWRVDQWEWRSGGVELMLERLAPSSADAAIATNPGQANIAVDLLVGTSALVAYELPWDGTGSADATAMFAAVSSAGAGWAGASLFVDQGTGALSAIGSAGRGRSTIGTATTALPVASPLLFDRISTLTVQLVGTDLALTHATPDQLVAGANRALVGTEIIQFTTATALGSGAWQLSGLLRGRGGTEGNIAEHAVGESFVLLDQSPVALSSSLVGSNPAAKIAVLGLADQTAVEAPILGRGISLQPLSPVQPSSATASDGTLTLNWTRRARGGWLWLDGVDEPLVEETEAYLVTYGPLNAPVSAWSVTSPTITLSPATMTSLRASLAHGAFYVQQVGTYSVSNALLLAQLP